MKFEQFIQILPDIWEKVKEESANSKYEFVDVLHMAEETLKDISVQTTVRCPKCSALLYSDKTGRVYKCPSCATVFRKV